MPKKMLISLLGMPPLDSKAEVESERNFVKGCSSLKFAGRSPVTLREEAATPRQTTMRTRKKPMRDLPKDSCERRVRAVNVAE